MTIFSILLGAALGAFWAKRTGGNTLDMLQYAAVCAIIVGMLFFIGGIVVSRLG